MLLSVRPLNNVVGVNDFESVDHLEFTEGDGPSLFFQLIDLSKDRSEQGFLPAGRRYMPATGATLQVTFDNLDDAKVVTKTATQPFSGDPSIWRVDLMSTDPVSGTVRAKFALTEGVVVRRAVLDAALRVRSA
jgi:hypothetical protein